MMPLSDDNSLRKTTPVVTYVLILINIVIFLLELGGGEAFIMKWAFIPKRFMSDPVANFPTFLTSMFMHAGWGHLIGNMLYLWIFGDNVEDRFGRIKFILFYIVCGVAAIVAHLLFNSDSAVPVLGASGAIAGILGAYILLFPQGKINVLLGPRITQMPALLVIGFWFLLQFFSGATAPGEASGQQDTETVAYMAHIGGFIAGVLITGLFRMTQKLS